MTGGIYECYRASAEIDLVGAYVLGDVASFGIDDVRLTDGVQEGRLAVIDVSEDGDDRGADRQEVGVSGLLLRLGRCSLSGL